MNPRFLILLYVLVTLSPLILSWATGLSPRSFWDELASGAGMVAFAVILVEFVLSGRFRSVSARLGMDNTMRFHQLVARAALVLALIHPYLFQTSFGSALPWDATRQLTLSSDMSGIMTGALAWLLLPVLIGLAVIREELDFRYETWRLMHGVGAMLIAGFALHHTLTLGRYSQSPYLSYLWIGLSVLALGAVLFIYVLKPVLQLRKPWSVQSVRPIARKVWEVTLAPTGHAGISYRAGQFVWLNIGNSPFSLRENPFSISSAPANGAELQFVIKELGDFTKTLGQIKPGTRACVDGPFGTLTAVNRSEPGIVLMACWVGIAALIGILRQLRLDDDPREAMLIYGNRTVDQIVYRDELEQMVQTGRTRVELVLAEPPDDWTGHSGVIDAALIHRVLTEDQLQQSLFILCGPPAMMNAVENTLMASGVSADRMLGERFNYD